MFLPLPLQDITVVEGILPKSQEIITIVHQFHLSGLAPLLLLLLPASALILASGMMVAFYFQQYVNNVYGRERKIGVGKEEGLEFTGVVTFCCTYIQY